MRLSELIDYAAEKYGIREEFKWDSFPGFSVLADPKTGHWAALLMRLRDKKTGEETEQCDIKCGQRTLSDLRAPFVTLPFRMTGYRWVGVVFGDETVPETVEETVQETTTEETTPAEEEIVDEDKGDELVGSASDGTFVVNDAGVIVGFETTRIPSLSRRVSAVSLLLPWLRLLSPAIR